MADIDLDACFRERLMNFPAWWESVGKRELILSAQVVPLFGEILMANNAKLVRWLAPCCLFILLLILILAVVFTATPGTTDANSIEATVVSQLHQTATAQARPTTRPATSPTGSPIVKPLPSPTITPNKP